MGPWPTQGDEKHFHQPLSMEAPPSPLSSRAKPRDGSSADLSWKCFSTERSEVEGPAVKGALCV